MSFMRFKDIDEIFRASILLKGVYSFFEFILGFILLKFNSTVLVSFLDSLFRKELLEDPRDFLANYVIKISSNFSPKLKLFLGLYLVIHGGIKLGLLTGLWFKKIKIYPIAIVIFILFLAQIVYEYIVRPSWLLIFLFLLDVVVIILTYLEYKHLKKLYK